MFEQLSGPLTEANRERRELLLSDPPDRDASREAIVVLVTATLMLVLRMYFLSAADVRRLVDVWASSSGSAGLGEFARILRDPSNRELVHLSVWTLAQVSAYLVLPALVVRLVLGKRLADYGLKLRGMFHSWWVYAAMFAGMVPLILLMSRTASFRHTYPFYHLGAREPLWPRFMCWELEYALQFVALEFFFRGFLLHGLRRQFGAYSILVMTMPYCMIHFGKPLPETLASIPAGLILGYMSLRTRSIWLGAGLHIAVAWSMDAAALR